MIKSGVLEKRVIDIEQIFNRQLELDEFEFLDMLVKDVAFTP